MTPESLQIDLLFEIRSCVTKLEILVGVTCAFWALAVYAIVVLRDVRAELRKIRDRLPKA